MSASGVAREAVTPDKRGADKGRSLALPGLFAIAVMHTLHFAKEVALPITIAVLLSFVLRPVVAQLCRRKLPKPIGAALVMAILVGATGAVTLRLAAPAAQWLIDSEATVLRLARRIQAVVQPVKRVSQAADQVQEAASVKVATSPEVHLRQASLSESLLAGTRDVAAGAAVALMLLCFLLASEDRFVHRVIQLVLGIHEPHEAAALAQATTRHISAYLFSVVLLNAAFGTVVGVAMFLLGMPNPALWGLMAALLEFIPYLGATMGTAMVAMAGMLVFDGSSRAFLPAIVYLSMACLQGGVIVPLVVGRMLTLHPVAVVVSLVLWGWLWGIPGAFLAVPLLATLKIVCDHSPSLAAFGQVLGGGGGSETPGSIATRSG